MLRVEIVKRHENGDSYKTIGDSLGISKATADRIAHGHKPGKEIASVLKLDPANDLLYTRNRNALLDTIARGWGYEGWSDLETQLIRWYLDKKG
jgi:hypothetical protein